MSRRCRSSDFIRRRSRLVFMPGLWPGWYGLLFIRHPVPFAAVLSQPLRSHLVKGLFFRGNAHALRALSLGDRLCLGLPGIVAWTMAAIWNEEAPVDAYENVEVDDEDLDGEVEYIEACLVLIVGWVGAWPLPTCIIDSYTEGRTCAEEDRGQEQDRYLVPEPSATELLHTRLARYDKPAEDE